MFFLLLTIPSTISTSLNLVTIYCLVWFCVCVYVCCFALFSNRKNTNRTKKSDTFSPNHLFLTKTDSLKTSNDSVYLSLKIQAVTIWLLQTTHNPSNFKTFCLYSPKTLQNQHAQNRDCCLFFCSPVFTLWSKLKLSYS